MKILMVHEYYRSSSPSGEDKVFEKERDLLLQNGMDVETLFFKNDWIGRKNGPSVLKTALYTPWSPFGQSQIKEAILKYQPDLVHFHNTFPVLSQSVIVQAKKMGLPTIQTFHNFRSICAQAILMRNGSICIECIQKKSAVPAVIHHCYRESFFATLPLAANIILHRWIKTWQTKVDRIIVLSEFNQKIFADAGFPETKLRVKPNFFSDGYPQREKLTNRINNWVYIGRFQEEKGVQFLPAVWKELGDKAPKLNLVGDGPLRENLVQEIRKLGLDNKIIFHGLCPPEKVWEILMQSCLLVFPSVCYEGFPLVIGEAYSAGVAVAASKLGTPSYIVKHGFTGVHFEPGNVQDMAKVLSCLIDKPATVIEMGTNARQEYFEKYTPEINYRLLLKIYQEAIEENQKIAQNFH